LCNFMPACVTMSRQGREGETGRLPRAIASGYRQSAQGRNTRRRESGPGGNQLPARPLVPRLCRVRSGGSNLAETRWAPSRRRQASPSKRGMHTAAASGLPYALDWARNLASHHAQRRERFVGGGHLTAGAPPCGAPSDSSGNSRRPGTRAGGAQRHRAGGRSERNSSKAARLRSGIRPPTRF
jgi:hypothetical protein